MHTQTTRLIPRYPGSKKKSSYQVDLSLYDAVIEPFCGSGRQTEAAIAAGVPNAFIADADLSVYAIWWTWLHGDHDIFYGALRKWRSEIIHESRLHNDKNVEFLISLNRLLLEWLDTSGRGFEALIHWFRCNFFRIIAGLVSKIGKSWKALKETLEQPRKYSLEAIAAASLTLRCMTFGGIVRNNAQGGLNVKWVDERLIHFLFRWKYNMPPKPLRTKIHLFHDWADCVAAFKKSNCCSAFALVDPPYWIPYVPGTERRGTGGMTPAYINHHPHADFTFKMAVDCTRELISSGKIGYLVHANYFSRCLDEALQECYSGQIKLKKLGRLDSINQARTSTTDNIEALWLFNVPQIAQISLPLFA